MGTGISLAGNAINEGVGTIDGKPSVLVEQALSNHFSDALRLRFTGSLGLDYNREVFATFAYGKYNGTERIVGSVSGYPLLARLSNADAFDIEGGLRYYLRPEGPIRTYVAGAAGLRFLQATDATFRVVEVGLTLANQPYFKGSALFLFGGDTGVSYDVSDTIALGAELGLRYQGKPGAEPLFADPKLAGGQRHGQPLVASDQRLHECAVLMQAHMDHPLFIVRVAASLVALALSTPGWAAPKAPEQASTLPGLPQVAQDVASPSAQVRRQALRGLRERGGPETLPLLAAPYRRCRDRHPRRRRCRRDHCLRAATTESFDQQRG